VQAAVNGMSQSVEQCLCVRSIGLPTGRVRREREGNNQQLTHSSAASWSAINCDFGDLDVEPDLRRARSQQCRIRDDHEIG